MNQGCSTLLGRTEKPLNDVRVYMCVWHDRCAPCQLGDECHRGQRDSLQQRHRQQLLASRTQYNHNLYRRPTYNQTTAAGHCTLLRCRLTQKNENVKFWQYYTATNTDVHRRTIHDLNMIRHICFIAYNAFRDWINYDLWYKNPKGMKHYWALIVCRVRS